MDSLRSWLFKHDPTDWWRTRHDDFWWWHTTLHWLYRHDITLDLATVWALTIGCGVLALVKLASWWALRSTRDRTDVGRALKRQKLTEMLIFTGFSVLYGLTLWGYYQHEHFGFWTRFGLRAVLIVGVVAATVFGLRFIVALIRTNQDAL